MSNRCVINADSHVAKTCVLITMALGGDMFADTLFGRFYSTVKRFHWEDLRDIATLLSRIESLPFCP
jgi:hypothetical protein